MKKYLYLFTCMSIALALLAGCSNYSISTSSEGIKNTLTKTTLSKSTDITDWKSTPYETVNNFDGVTMIVKKETTSSTGLKVTFKNSSNNRCIYGEYFCLEKKITGSWYQVPVVIKGSYGFDDIGYNLVSGVNRELEVKWNWLYGSLNAGEYRIVKDILNFRGTGDYDTYYLAAEFTIY